MEEYLPSLPFAEFFYRLNMILPILGIAILAAIAVLVALLPVSAAVSYVFARRIKQRLEVLINVAHTAQTGDYSVRVPVSGHDEITRLQNDFNRMIASLDTTVTDLREEREKVAALLKRRHELMANVSHELRTPLATIRAYLESAQRRGEAAEGIALDANDLVIVQREADALQTLIDDLFALSRAEGPTDRCCCAHHARGRDRCAAGMAHQSHHRQRTDSTVAAACPGRCNAP
jgi:signal transduction histidine kinase